MPVKLLDGARKRLHGILMQVGYSDARSEHGVVRVGGSQRRSCLRRKLIQL